MEREVKQVRAGIRFSVKIAIQTRREQGHYISWAPALDLYSQGDNRDEAHSNCIEAIQLFFESCYRRGVLDQVLKDVGLEPDREVVHVPTDDDGTVVDVSLPLLVAQRNAEITAC